MLNILFEYIEALGGYINDDLSFQIRDEHITYKITEGQTKVPHVLTKQEQKELEEYDKAKTRYSYSSEPVIRKWDYISNGRLRFEVLDNKFYKDTENRGIESRLGEILIDLYEKSEKVKNDRLRKEEEKRKQEEERKAREQMGKIYNKEVDRTMALENIAEDYDMACKIRSYIAAVERKTDLTEEELDWIAWARAKADWYDPIINATDKYFGSREHGKDKESKKPQKKYYW